MSGLPHPNVQPTLQRVRVLWNVFNPNVQPTLQRVREIWNKTNGKDIHPGQDQMWIQVYVGQDARRKFLMKFLEWLAFATELTIAVMALPGFLFIHAPVLGACCIGKVKITLKTYS